MVDKDKWEIVDVGYFSPLLSLKNDLEALTLALTIALVASSEDFRRMACRMAAIVSKSMDEKEIDKAKMLALAHGAANGFPDEGDKECE